MSPSSLSLRCFALLLGLLCAGCASMFTSPTAPLAATHYAAGDGSHRTLLVFLPGIGDSGRDFDRQGFIEAVRRQGLPVDMITADAHIGYYMNRSVVDRLKQDVIDPARRDGYQQIWLVGISLGGLGAFLYSERHPGDIQGVVAIAPYLGDHELIREIRAAGGPTEWEPAYDDDDFRRMLWTWLGQYASDDDGMRPRLVLAYGSDDRYADAHDLLATLLPRSQVIRGPGNHDWSTWTRLWDQVLTTVEFDVAATARTNPGSRPPSPAVSIGYAWGKGPAHNQEQRPSPCPSAPAQQTGCRAPSG